MKFVFTESRQLLTLTELHKILQKRRRYSELHKILQNIDDIGNKNTIIRGDFNFHFNSKLEVKVGKPTLNKKSMEK